MIKFSAQGHKNIIARHKTTLEFTADNNLRLNGDCIVGVSASKLPQATTGKIEITLKIGKISHCFTAIANPSFTSHSELVIRMSAHQDERTYAYRADSAAIYLPKDMIKLLQNPNKIINITIENINSDPDTDLVHPILP